MAKIKYPHLFEPMTIRGKTFKNRFYSAPNANSFVDDGKPNDYYIQYMEEKARGGAGMVVISEVPVDEYGAHEHHFKFDRDSKPLISELVDAIRQHGAMVEVELTHGGDAVDPYFNEGGKIISSMGFFRSDGLEVTCMDEKMIERTVQKYVDAALFWQGCGVDVIMIHAGHHWLLNQFLSPLWNRRTDKFGGPIENRMRFPVMVFKAVREAVGDSMIIDVRVSVDDLKEGGNTFKDTYVFLKAIEPYIDLINVSCGSSMDTGSLVQTSTFQQKAPLVKYSEMIKQSDLTPKVILHGSLTDPEMMEQFIAEGKCDAVACARAIIADPFIVKKAQYGMDEDIRPCLRCNFCLMGNKLGDKLNPNGFPVTDGRTGCTVNPLARHENRKKREYAVISKKKVAIVGGGPAGMQAAFTAFDRGHDVTLIEKNGELGGWLRFTDKDQYKGDLRKFKNYLVHQVEKRGIKVMLNTEADEALMEKLDPDVILVCSGSEPVVPRITGIENARYTADVYFGFEPGKRVVIIGGGLVGCETGLDLAAQGHEVTVVEALGSIARDCNYLTLSGFMRECEGKPLTFRVNTKVTEVKENGVEVEVNGEKLFIEADTVLYSVGLRSTGNALADRLRPYAYETVVIGDAKSSKKVYEAINDAYDTAMDIGNV